jgi:hypothetical protein
MPGDSIVTWDGVDRTFPRQWYRSAIPGAMVLTMCGLFTYHTPEALWLAVAIACVGSVACLLLHGGLIVTPTGLAWYTFCPRWRYRVVPWDAVLDVRRTLGFLEPIRLDVRHGRYEPWVWGKPQPNRVLTLEVWSNGYASGQDLWDAIRTNRPADAHPTVA